MVNKQLAIFINVCLEDSAIYKLLSLDIVDDLQEIIKACNTQDELQRTVLERVFNLYSRLLKKPEAAAKVVVQKHTVFKAILFMN